ncbi:hypothetical protein V6N11_041915 [Hibiscus sabdariffa]|uniref:Uncharacterized protein n=2 Tax=Hibiscus sabdariffa TaxID=183260 RepID=A0ABR2BV05_9ROSI
MRTTKLRIFSRTISLRVGHYWCLKLLCYLERRTLNGRLLKSNFVQKLEIQCRRSIRTIFIIIKIQTRFDFGNTHHIEIFIDENRNYPRLFAGWKKQPLVVKKFDGGDGEH